MRVITVIVRLLGWLLVLVGLPILLAAYGWPGPDHFPQGEDWRALVEIPDDRRLADIIVIAGWIIWLLIIAWLIRRIITVAHMTPAETTPQERWRIPGPLGAIAAVLLGTAATTAATTAGAAPTAAHTVTDTGLQDQAPISRPIAAEPPLSDGQYRVRAGDTLWGIATEHLGNPWRWEEIYHLNQYRPQPDGERLSDPDIIRPGWILTLPGAPVAPPPAEPPEAPPAPQPPAGSAPGPADAPAESQSPYPVEEDGGFWLPSGAWIGAGLAAAVAGALALRRARRTRRAALGKPLPPPTATPAALRPITDAATEPAPQTDDEAAAWDVFDEASLAVLTGPGAIAATRAILATHLTADPTAPQPVIISPATLARLLPETEAAAGLVEVVEDPGAAMQREILARTRRAEAGEAAGPMLLAFTGDGDTPTTPLAGLNIRVLHLEDDTAGGGVLVGTDGTTPHGRLEHLTPGDLTAILTTLDPPATPEIEEPPTPPDPPTPAATLEPPSLSEPQAAGKPAVRLCVFGPITITNAGEPVTGLRARSRELLALLAETHPRSASKDHLIEELLPDVTISRAAGHLRTLVSAARTSLRTATAHPKEAFVIADGDTYRLDENVITCDLWEFRAGLREARIDDDPAEKVGHLTQALNAYTGPFADGCLSDWIEPVREGLRREHTKAAVSLARLYSEADDHIAAASTLRDACNDAPLDEPLHQEAINAAFQAGRSDWALALFRSLKAALADIGERPEQTTYSMFNEPPTPPNSPA